MGGFFSVYFPIHEYLVDVSGKLVGKYTIVPWTNMGYGDVSMDMESRLFVDSLPNICLFGAWKNII